MKLSDWVLISSPFLLCGRGRGDEEERLIPKLATSERLWVCAVADTGLCVPHPQVVFGDGTENRRFGAGGGWGVNVDWEGGY